MEKPMSKREINFLATAARLGLPLDDYVPVNKFPPGTKKYAAAAEKRRTFVLEVNKALFREKLDKEAALVGLQSAGRPVFTREKLAAARALLLTDPKNRALKKFIKEKTSQETTHAQ